MINKKNQLMEKHLSVYILQMYHLAFASFAITERLQL